MEEIWQLWQDKAHSPAMNMAIDEALLLSAPERRTSLLRLYEWSSDAVSIGYTQKISKVPDLRAGVVRRPTGGGIVYHRHHFTYTVVLPEWHWIVKDTKPVESYGWINRAVQDALQLLALNSSLAEDDIPKSVDRAGMVCFVTPTKYDLVTEKRKIAGSAQRRVKEGVLHQGSIEMENIDSISATLLREALPKGFAKILNCQFTPFLPSADLLLSAEKIADEKYGTEEWNFKR